MGTWREKQAASKLGKQTDGWGTSAHIHSTQGTTPNNRVTVEELKSKTGESEKWTLVLVGLL